VGRACSIVSTAISAFSTVAAAAPVLLWGPGVFAQLISLPVALAIAITSVGAFVAAPEAHSSSAELMLAKAAKKSPPRTQEKVSTGSSGDVPIPPWLLKAKRGRS
jgi:hypothetical protein